MANYDNMEIKGVHRWPLLGAFCVALFALILVTGSVLSGAKPVTTAESPIVTERSLLIRDGTYGNVLIFDAISRNLLASFGKGDGAFIRISMRGMARERSSRKLDLLSPYTLMKTANGHLYITDPLSGQKIRVNAFGPIATKSFSQFLERDYSEKGAEG